MSYLFNTSKWELKEYPTNPYNKETILMTLTASDTKEIIALGSFKKSTEAYSPDKETDFDREEESRANWRLLAHAPEMYRMLQWVWIRLNNESLFDKEGIKQVIHELLLDMEGTFTHRQIKEYERRKNADSNVES